MNEGNAIIKGKRRQDNKRQRHSPGILGQMEAEELWMTVGRRERLSAGEKRPLPQQAVGAGGLDAEERPETKQAPESKEG